MINVEGTSLPGGATSGQADLGTEQARKASQQVSTPPQYMPHFLPPGSIPV